MLFLPLIANAKVFKIENTFVCDDIETMMSHFETKYGESPLWFGKSKGDDDTIIGLTIFVNKETQTWTIMKFNKVSSCVMASGTGFELSITGFDDKIKEHKEKQQEGKPKGSEGL